MDAARAEVVANIVGERVLESLEQQEAELDDQIKRLEQADDDELERIRARRVRQMQEQAQRAQQLRALGHGEYALITDTHEFFDAIKHSEMVVVHFFTPSNDFCSLIDGHLQRLAPRHLETKFARINAEKAEFLVEKLGVWMIPCLALIRKQKIVKMVQGLDELGGSDQFSTAFLAYYLSLQEVVKYDGPEPENPSDDCGNPYATNAQAGSTSHHDDRPSSNIRQAIFYDSDLSEED